MPISLVSRYILTAHVGPFLFAFTIITFILVMDVIFEIANLIVGKGLDIFIVLEIFVLNLAWIAALSVPMSVLVATLMAFGRLSADNEITGFKAGGVSFYRMVLPVLVAGGMLAAGNLYFMDKVLPEANYRARSLMNDVHRARPTLGFREGIFMDDIQGYRLLIDRINPRSNEVSSITIYETGLAGVPRILTAQQGKLDIRPDGSVITITLVNGELHQRDEKNPGRYFKEVFERQRLIIRGSPRGVQRTDAGDRTDRELSIAMMREKVTQWQRDIDASRQRLRPVQGTPADAGQAGAQERQDRQLIDVRQQQINGYLVEIHKKYAIPIACMIFVLIGAPLGIRIRRSGIGISVGVSLGFFLLYWACLIGGEELADRNLVGPAAAMWAANVLIGVPGVLLVWRAGRERPFFR
jgi:lipopolysaccharide export system permease protein